jgi:hypothetical protein
VLIADLRRFSRELPRPADRIIAHGTAWARKSAEEGSTQSRLLDIRELGRRPTITYPQLVFSHSSPYTGFQIATFGVIEFVLANPPSTATFSNKPVVHFLPVNCTELLTLAP